jgi:hypothetical protein
MRRILVAAAAVVLVPGVTWAKEAPNPAPSPVPKVKKICRYNPPPTGSNRPGKRVCKTAEEWAQTDGVTVDYDRMSTGTPIRSQGIDDSGGN